MQFWIFLGNNGSTKISQLLMIGKTSGVREISRNLLQTVAMFFRISSWQSIEKIFTKTSFGKSKMLVVNLRLFSFNDDSLEMLASAIFFLLQRMYSELTS